MRRRPETVQALEAATDPLDRHRRKCQVCQHPDREEIEEEFVNWRSPWHLADAYGIQDYRSIYRHATATGLIHARRANMRWALDAILEHGPGHVNADSVIRAIRAYSCLDENNKWSEPPTEVIFSVADRRTPPSARSHLTLSVEAKPGQSLDDNRRDSTEPSSLDGEDDLRQGTALGAPQMPQTQEGF